jgi:hypothetical protein
MKNMFEKIIFYFKVYLEQFWTWSLIFHTCSFRDPAYVQSIFHFCHTRCSISLVTCRVLLFLFRNYSALEFYPYKSHSLHSPKKKEWSGVQMKAPRWPQNWTTLVNPSSRKFCAKEFRKVSWETWLCTILLVECRETLWFDDCEGTAFSLIRFVYLETEPPEIPTSYSGTRCIYVCFKLQAYLCQCV